MRQPRAVVVTSAVMVALVLAGLVALVASVVTDERPSARDVHAFERAVLEPAKQAGKTDELGLKVAIGDLGSGGSEGGEQVTSPAVVAEQVTAWRRDLVAARDAFLGAPAPGGLGQARGSFVLALDRYLASVDAIRAATAVAAGAERDRLLDDAIEAGRDGDRLYDVGSGRLQDVRRKAGLAPSTDFPDPATRDS